MHRILHYCINEADVGLTVKKYLQSKGFSSQNLIELKKKPDCILVNHQPVFVNFILQSGDTLTVHIIEETSSQTIPPIDLPLEIVYEDEDLLVINKAAGMPVHPSMNNYDTSVANALAWYFKMQNIPFVFRCINRLDKDTSGLMLVAKHFVSAGILSGMLHQKICREYLALIRGTVTPPAGTISAPIGRKPGSVIERMVDYEHGEQAVTHYRMVAESSGHSLISLRLETGRTHQIRVHMKHIGFPLIGDRLYNPDTTLIERQALHSHRLIFPHPITGVRMDFTSPLPKDMRQIISSD